MIAIPLTRKASKLAQRGQSWFFADDLAERPAGAGLFRLSDAEGRDLGLCVHSPRSRIALRRCGGWPAAGLPDPGAFFAARLAQALRQRQPLLAQLHPELAGLRLVHGEGDALPGLVVDRYADCLVLQSSHPVVEMHLTEIVPWLREELQPRSILARNDLPVRRREGLVEEVRLLEGRRVEEVQIEEGGLRHRVDLWCGQKTGFFLDQRPARAWVQARAEGLRVLDLFCYQGGFALAARRGGARQVVAIDQSAAALARLAQGQEDNALEAIETRCGNVFDLLRGLRQAGQSYDLVVLDPPAFAKSRREVEGALRGYRDLNRQALRLLAPGGRLLSCSCSHHMDAVRFEAMLRQAGAELPFAVSMRGRLAAGEDHPVSLHLPESEYLKVYVLQRPWT